MSACVHVHVYVVRGHEGGCLITNTHTHTHTMASHIHTHTFTHDHITEVSVSMTIRKPAHFLIPSHSHRHTHLINIASFPVSRMSKTLGPGNEASTHS